jgi:hypothetical protein
MGGDMGARSRNLAITDSSLACPMFLKLEPLPCCLTTLLEGIEKEVSPDQKGVGIPIWHFYSA